MELTESLKELLIETANMLKGRDRRRFMALTVRELGPGGQRLAERELGWSRVTIRKGMRELEAEEPSDGSTGHTHPGRLRAEERLPQLLTDICAVIEQHRHSHPDCSSDQREACLSAAEVRRRLIADFGYTDAELPTVQTIATKLKLLGYYPRRSSRPERSSSAADPSGQKTPYPISSSSSEVEA